jgi:hypothetical protein
MFWFPYRTTYHVSGRLSSGYLLEELDDLKSRLASMEIPSASQKLIWTRPNRKGMSQFHRSITGNAMITAITAIKITVRKKIPKKSPTELLRFILFL